MTGVTVAGVGLHPFGRFDGVSTTDMGVVAVRAALREAGIGKGDFQAAFCGTAYGGVATGHKVLSRLGMTGMPIVDVEAGCASGGAALMLAAAAIRAGQYDTVLVFGTEKMPRGIIRSSFFEPWQEEAGLAATPAFFGLRAQRLCLTSGVTKEHLAQVVVKNRRHGAANPDAMYQKETTVEAVLASRVVCEPLHLFMLCSPNEGAAALVLRRADLAPSGVTLAAAVLRSHIPGSVLSESTPLAGLADDDVPAPTTLAATDAYEEAGLGPSDLHVVECQDTDAARELGSCEELGLCEPGGSAALLEFGCHHHGRPSPGQPERWAAVQGRAARCLRARSGGRARATAAGRVRAAPGRGGPGRVVAHGGPGSERRRRDPHPLIRLSTHDGTTTDGAPAAVIRSGGRLAPPAVERGVKREDASVRAGDPVPAGRRVFGHPDDGRHEGPPRHRPVERLVVAEDPPVRGNQSVPRSAGSALHADDGCVQVERISGP